MHVNDMTEDQLDTLIDIGTGVTEAGYPFHLSAIDSLVAMGFVVSAEEPWALTSAGAKALNGEDDDASR